MRCPLRSECVALDRRMVRSYETGMKPIYTKSTFWRRLPQFHPAIFRAAVRTALHSRRTFERFASHDEIFNGARFDASGGTTGHPFWLEAFKHERQTIKSVLEIGAFEGKTTVFIAWLFPNARITCIDPWKNYNEVSAGMDAVGEAFRSNIALFADRVRPIQGYSSDELPKLIDAGESFDLIFIDGSHY
jgi:hypothetical protein